MSKTKPRLLSIFSAALILFCVVFYFEKQVNSEINNPSLLQSHTSVPNQNTAGKEFLDQLQTGDNKNTGKKNLENPSPNPSGSDPFKEFLEKQKSRDQVISPFGKI